MEHEARKKIKKEKKGREERREKKTEKRIKEEENGREEKREKKTEKRIKEEEEKKKMKVQWLRKAMEEKGKPHKTQRRDESDEEYYERIGVKFTQPVTITVFTPNEMREWTRKWVAENTGTQVEPCEMNEARAQLIVSEMIACELEHKYVPRTAVDDIAHTSKLYNVPESNVIYAIHLLSKT